MIELAARMTEVWNAVHGRNPCSKVQGKVPDIGISWETDLEKNPEHQDVNDKGKIGFMIRPVQARGGTHIFLGDIPLDKIRDESPGIQRWRSFL